MRDKFWLGMDSEKRSRVLIDVLPWNSHGATKKITENLRTVGISTEIRTDCLLGSSLERHRYANLLVASY
jgi:hypothetical protein